MYGCVYVCVRACVWVCVCVCVGGWVCVGVCVSTHIKISSYRLPKYSHFSLAFISSHNTMETLQKKTHGAPKNVQYEATHKYVDLFKLQRKPTEDLKNFSFQRDFYLIKLFLLDK